jgi:hypothetical protein
VAEQRIDQAMQAWFPQCASIAERKPFDEADLQNISNVLRSIGRESWSRIPRIYSTLRIINQLPVIESFLAQGLSDIWFPFTHKTLPGSLKSQTARNNFIEAQKLVLTKALDLEKEDGKHRHFSKSEDIPLVPLARLGIGGYAVVEKVLSILSRREYARKLLSRGPTFRKNKVALQDFEAELAVLKKLSHMHIVELVGSYTDPKYAPSNR